MAGEVLAGFESGHDEPRDELAGAAVLSPIVDEEILEREASDFVAHYPDGSSEVLLSVPSYDFNWQTSYVLRAPRMLPAGTRIVHTTTWDNSAQNPANPDPNREVPWGLQSWDEMLFG